MSYHRIFMESIGYRRIKILGIVAMAAAVLVLVLFDHALKRHDAIGDLYAWIDETIGRYVVCGIVGVAGIYWFIVGYRGQKKERQAKDEADTEPDN